MTIYDEAWVERTEAEFKRLEAEGLYHPEQEHASCGVGLVVAIDGKPRRQVVESAIKALKSIWHRGAVDADGKTGDGGGDPRADPGGLLRGPGAADRASAAGRAAGGEFPTASRSPRGWCPVRRTWSSKKATGMCTWIPAPSPLPSASTAPRCSVDGALHHLPRGLAIDGDHQPHPAGRMLLLG